MCRLLNGMKEANAHNPTIFKCNLKIFEIYYRDNYCYKLFNNR